MAHTCPERAEDMVEDADAESGGSGDRGRFEVQVVSIAVDEETRVPGTSGLDGEAAVSNDVPGSSRLTTGILARAAEAIELTMDGSAADKLSANGRLGEGIEAGAPFDTDGSSEVKLSTAGIEVGIGTGTIVGTETCGGATTVTGTEVVMLARGLNGLPPCELEWL